MHRHFITSICLFTTLVSGLSSAVAQETIQLVVDQSQSSVVVTIPFLSGMDDTSISGNAIIELDSAEEPFSVARITELNMTMADGFTITHPLAEVMVPENGANVSFIEVGPAGMVDANNQFDQTGNLFGVTGMAFVDDVLNIAEDVDLATVKPVPFDVESAQLSVDGNVLTVAADIFIPFEFEVLTTTAEMTLDGQVVLTGELSTLMIGDVNCDGTVDLLDVGPFVDAVTNGVFNSKADINGDSSVDLLDVGPFVALISGG